MHFNSEKESDKSRNEAVELSSTAGAVVAVSTYEISFFIDMKVSRERERKKKKQMNVCVSESACSILQKAKS